MADAAAAAPYQHLGLGVGLFGGAGPAADVFSGIPEAVPDVGVQLCSQNTPSVLIPWIIAE